MADFKLGVTSANCSCFKQFIVSVDEMGHLEKRGRLYLPFHSWKQSTERKELM